MKTLTVANQKGGVGKTSLAVNLAAGLARQGKRTLLVDLDPQGNATTWLLGLEATGGKGVAEALLTRRLGPEHVREVQGRPHLAVMPSTPALADADLTLARATGGQNILRKLLEKSAASWDYVICDTPPAAGVYTVSAVCAADGVLAPITAAFLSLAGLRRLEEAVDQAVEYLDARARVIGYVLFASDQREGITAEAREIVKREAPGRLLKAEIRVSTSAKSCPARRRVALDDGEDARGAEDYAALLKEVLARLNQGAR